ncbi:hypothetical protein E2562_020718 [Oryza meyeriana var. granulata]|uniref:Uncharacterized protein n=1 Tax=Oryza meyeriana var. granulata TaxID=110450 RepID=A0A6G1EN35_9ORYZ|nr:hypothetical protein E2562_020718 [Oryza meyeriana var. granulata]
MPIPPARSTTTFQSRASRSQSCSRPSHREIAGAPPPIRLEQPADRCRRPSIVWSTTSCAAAGTISSCAACEHWGSKSNCIGCRGTRVASIR